MSAVASIFMVVFAIVTAIRLERQGVTRDTDPLLFGVCSSLARHYDLSVFWVRLIAVALIGHPAGTLCYLVFVSLLPTGKKA